MNIRYTRTFHHQMGQFPLYMKMVSMFWPRQESYLLYKEEVEKDFLLLAVVFLIPNANFMPTLPIYSRLSYSLPLYFSGVVISALFQCQDRFLSLHPYVYNFFKLSACLKSKSLSGRPIKGAKVLDLH